MRLHRKIHQLERRAVAQRQIIAAQGPALLAGVKAQATPLRLVGLGLVLGALSEQVGAKRPLSAFIGSGLAMYRFVKPYRDYWLALASTPERAP